MKRIGLISDTHSYLDERVFHYFSDCDEIWHAGDFGTAEISDKLAAFKPLKGVYGNIDGNDIRIIYPKNLLFIIEGLKIFITHIGGYPGKYAPDARQVIVSEKPDIFVCGHSHILKVITDTKNHNMLCINPGAAGIHGFHKVRTLIKFDIESKKISNMKAIELGKRA
ncbi:MAG: metallophosphoesterase family protein [Cytophagaceae bacterium]